MTPRKGFVSLLYLHVVQWEHVLLWEMPYAASEANALLVELLKRPPGALV